MKYYLLKCEIKSGDLNEENYGVLILDDDKRREYVCNISDCVDEVSAMVECMNEYNVEPHQAIDIIEDFKFNKKVNLHI